MSSIEAMEEPNQFIAADHPQHDYARLRDQCDSAMNELETLRKRHTQILSRCEKASKEADYYRKQHELISSEQKILLADRNKLHQDYEEIVLLREQEKLETTKTKPTEEEHNECTPPSKSPGSLGNLQQENEDLNYKFDDLQADHDLLASRFKQLQEENMNLKEQSELVSLKHNLLIEEHNALKQRCATAIRGYKKALTNRDESVEEANKKYAIAMRELEQVNILKIQMKKEINKLRDERNCALQEYKLVMSERDTVHQEIEKLQDDLGQTKDNAKIINEEKEKISLEKESLHQETMAVLAERDHVTKEVHDLNARLQIALKEKETSVKQLEEQRQNFEMLKQERNAAKKERGEAIVHRDKILKECFEVKRLFASMETSGCDQTEGLKKQFDKLSRELTLAWNKSEVAMKRRDWMFSERDKVLRESETMKEKYSKLLNEKAVVDEQVELLTSQNVDAQKKYKEYVRKSLAVSSITKDILLSSQDSAIDSDPPPYHIEKVILERTCKDEDFGFQIRGGSDIPISPTDTSIFVVEISPGSIATDKLKVNDCIIRVNNTDMTNIQSGAAYEAIYSSNYLNMTILRHTKDGFKSPLQRIEIKSNEEKHIGLSIDSGLHIKRIDPGSAAAEEETLSIGDKILTVNGQSIENMTYEEAKLLLKRSILSLTVLKPSVSTTSSQPSLPHHTDDEKNELNSNEKMFHDIPKILNSNEKMFLDTTPMTPMSTVIPHHSRSPSAPVHITATNTDHILTNNIHKRSHSGIGQMSDDELKKISDQLLIEVQRRREDDLKRNNCERNEDIKSLPRNSLTIKTEQVHTAPPIQPNIFTCERRPMSPRSSKQSVSSGSTSRYSHDATHMTPSSPHTFSHSDPFCLEGKTIGPITNNVNTNPPIVHRGHHGKRHKPCFPPQSIAEMVQNHTQNSPLSFAEGTSSLSFQEYSQNMTPSPASYYDYRHYGTFPGKRLDPATRTSHSSMNTKPSSTPSNGYYKSCSSHGSLNSSEFSDKGIVGHIEPVREETLSQKTVPNSVRSSRRSSGPMSPRISGTRGSRQRSSTSPTSYTHSRKNVQRNKSSCEEEAPRKTVIEKGQYPLGITIAQGLANGGIFVEGVNEESIASKVGLKYGDQLLEYNGINLRMASYEQAALILKQSAVENTVIVLAQYNPHKMQESRNISSNNTPEYEIIEKPRLIRVDRDPPSTPLGIQIIGGNSIGVFISDIQKDSLVDDLQHGLKCGDQILKYNAKDLRRSTLEEATLELGKPTEVADFHVQYNPAGYAKAQSEIGDSFFVRVMFDRPHPPKGELAFRRNDILHVTETLHKEQLGVWRASIVTDNVENDEYKKTKGKIPSKGKAEQELLVRRSSGFGEDKLKGRKSLFRRSKKGSSHHGINHSRESSDSKADFDITSTISSGTSFALTQIADELIAYQYVKRYDSSSARPVAIVGAMAEPICDKLVVESAIKFARCLPDFNETSKEIVEYIDYKLSRKGDRFECITPQSITDVISKSKHCLLDINPEAIDKLVSLQFYPIIIFVKFKSAKQIKDVRDNHYIRDKIPNKSAKDLYEISAKVEKDYKHHFNAIVSGNSLTSICKDIVDCVQEQQRKPLWIADDSTVTLNSR